MGKQKNISIKKRIKSIFVLVIVFISVAYSIFIFINKKNEYFYKKQTLQSSSDQNQKAVLKHRVEGVINYINFIRNRNLDFSDSLCKQIVLDRIEKIRFEHGGYVFVNTYQGQALVFDGAVVEGYKDMSNITDPEGVRLYDIEIEAAKKADGDFITYKFKTIGSDSILPKISYIKGYDDWQWIVGAGFYLQDIKRELITIEKEYYDELKSELFFGILLLFLFSLFMFILSNYFTRYLAKELNVFFDFFSRLALTNQKIDTNKIFFTEFRRLANEANLMIDEKNKLEEELLQAQSTLKENLSFFENIDKISFLLSKTITHKEIIQSVINELAILFNCNQSWLLFPCDPDAGKYLIPYQNNTSATQKQQVVNNEIQLDDYSRHLMMLAIEKNEPIPAYFDDPEASESETAKMFNIKAQLTVKVATKLGKPWLLGLYQTTSMRKWTDYDVRLIKEIASRLAQALDNIELYKNLQKSEKKVREYSTNLENRVLQRTNELSKSEKALTYLLEDMNEAQQNLINANDKLDLLNRELESFSFSISHDLRAPLTRLDGFSRALTEQLGDKLDDTSKHFLDRIRSSSQHMGELIKDILALSKINRRELQIFSIDISTISKKIMNEIVESSAKRESIINIHDNIRVLADPTLIEVLLRNIIENAWKFTQKEPVTEIEIGKETKEGKEIIFVKDNGIGFDMKYYEQVFAVFRRLHSDNDFQGTGIGLATVQRIVHRHKGDVWAESEEGKGSTFYFRL
ncbi:MAG: cache domain-containing protein [Bacteroidota bacterium]|nr:cache domain-containing protein [Bacteroidota bacterium]